MINEDVVQPGHGFGTDGAAVSDERTPAITAEADAEILLFDLA